MKAETVRCSKCGKQIGCEKDEIGLVIICPHCGRETIAMTHEQELRKKRSSALSVRPNMIREHEENEKLCFWLGFILNLPGVFVAMALGKQGCVKAALTGFAISVGVWFVICLFLVVLTAVAR